MEITFRSCLRRGSGATTMSSHDAPHGIRSRDQPLACVELLPPIHFGAASRRRPIALQRRLWPMASAPMPVRLSLDGSHLAHRPSGRVRPRAVPGRFARRQDFTTRIEPLRLLARRNGCVALGIHALDQAMVARARLLIAVNTEREPSARNRKRSLAALEPQVDLQGRSEGEAMGSVSHFVGWPSITPASRRSRAGDGVCSHNRRLRLWPVGSRRWRIPTALVAAQRKHPSIGGYARLAANHRLCYQIVSRDQLAEAIPRGSPGLERS